MENLPTVPPTVIKRVRTSEFDPYIKSLTDVFDKYQLNRVMGLQAAMEGSPLLTNEPDPDSDAFEGLADQLSRLILADETRKKKSLGMTSSQRTRMLSMNAPPLDTVPSVFFQSDFSLGNPNTFLQVCENTDFSKLTLADVSLTSSRLQDKLSFLRDTVDVYLVREISRRASSFFNALSTLQGLHLETQSCVSQINELRAKLSEMAKVGVNQALEVGRLDTRLQNLGRLYDGIKRISSIQQTQPMIEALLEEESYSSALDLIEETAQDLKGISEIPKADNSKALDLRGVAGIHHLSGKLTTISKTIGKSMISQFVQILITDIKGIVDSMDTTTKLAERQLNYPVSTYIKNIMKFKHETLKSSNESLAADSSSTLNEMIQERIQPLIEGLLRMNLLGTAIQNYKDTLIKEIKNLTRKV
jgi:hypothetical protein